MRFQTARSLLSAVRWREVLVMQGAPAMGAAFSAGRLTSTQLPALVLFGAGSVLLVAHIWCLNDWADCAADQLDPRKREGTFAQKGVGRETFLAFSLLLLVLGLACFALLDPRMLLIAAAIALLGAQYSLPGISAKRAGLLSSVPHLLGGFLHFLLGYALFSGIDRRSLSIAPYFALVFTAGHAVQEAQDHEADAACGVRTKAVRFGKRAVFLGALSGFLAAHAHLALLAWMEVVPARLGALAVAGSYFQLKVSLEAWNDGLTAGSLERLRGRYRVIFGAIGLGMLSTLFD